MISSRTNIVHSSLDLSGPHYIYREAIWVEWLMRIFLMSLAFGLSLLALSYMHIQMLVALFGLLCAAGLLLMAFVLRKGESGVQFVCMPDGIFFPERKLFAAEPASWLQVPWCNVLEYRVQMMLDDTSSQGIAMQLAVTQEELRRYLSSRQLYGQHFSLNGPSGQTETARVGFTTFLPRPEKVLMQLHAFDSLHPGGQVGIPPVLGEMMAARD